MPPSVNSTHPDMTGYQVMTVEKRISYSPLTSYWVMSDDTHDNKRKRPGAKNKNTYVVEYLVHVFVFTNMAGILSTNFVYNFIFVSQAYGVMMNIIKLKHMYKWVWLLPSLSGLLWLHVVITCPPPPHVHSEMSTSVNSPHPGYQVMTVEKHISHSLLTIYCVMSDDW